MPKKPVILIPCNQVEVQETPAHVVKQQYIRPVVEVLGAMPLLLPAIGNDFDFGSIAACIDGILLTGSPSHVSPGCYGAERQFEDSHLDMARDGTTLPLLQTAIERDIPTFAICRGFQELNVACGGTLHQYVHKVPGKNDHRRDEKNPLPREYERQAHTVRAEKGGWFERLGLPAAFMVNSLHTQGVDRLGAGLHVEARAEDGLIEAISMPGKRFIVGMQWHPEGDFYINPPDRMLFEAFKTALVRK